MLKNPNFTNQNIKRHKALTNPSLTKLDIEKFTEIRTISLQALCMVTLTMLPVSIFFSKLSMLPWQSFCLENLELTACNLRHYLSPCIMSVQYIGGYHEYIGGIP